MSICVLEKGSYRFFPSSEPCQSDLCCQLKISRRLNEAVSHVPLPNRAFKEFLSNCERKEDPRIVVRNDLSPLKETCHTSWNEKFKPWTRVHSEPTEQYILATKREMVKENGVTGKIGWKRSSLSGENDVEPWLGGSNELQNDPTRLET